MPSSTDLSGLEPAAFEHLVTALALKVLGAGATGFGPGPDAGRDGWFEGEAPYPSAKTRWKGTWHIQCKFHAPHLSKNPQKWLIAQVRAELEAYKQPGSRRTWPDNWIIATNIDPSGDGGRGTFDQTKKLVAQAHSGLEKRFHIWGGAKIRSFLDDFPTVAARFGHFLTPGNVLASLLSQVSDDRSSVEDIVRYSVLRGIEDQRHTRLEQAGSPDDRRPGIDALFVDLPYAEERCKVGGQAIATISIASATNHTLNAEDAQGERWAIWRARPSRASVWFVRAGPGRGKSSISQFFCQVQRAALILQPEGLPVHPDTRALAQRIEARARAMGCWPSVPRVPLWVELKSYAAWIGEQGPGRPRGVASYLCSVLHRETEALVPVKVLRRALRERSWVVIFDGLDEVPSDVKDLVANEVVSFVRDTSVSSDLFSICTSRPQGYSGQFDALGGAVVDLVDLPPKLALECATKVAEIDQSVPDAARARASLARSLESPAVRELMTTPLQSHIMAVLVRNGQQPPERKWDLYRRFYEVIRVREANRELPDHRLRELFQRDPALIDAVHQRLGFALHSRAERASGADASLTKVEFRRVVEDVVKEARASADVAPVVETLMRATTERLVLINTPDQGDRVRFDLRAIQEFFAAEFLYSDTAADVVRERLELVVGDSHWREVVQFVLGAFISQRRATEWAVALDVLRAVDDGGGDDSERALAGKLARGALHCSLLFENGAAENNLKTREQLRPLLAPVTSATDRALTDVLGRVTPPESRAWVRRWAVEQVRALRPAESRGALRVVAALCPDSPDEAGDVLDLLDGVATEQVGDLLSELWREERIDPEHRNRGAWLTEARVRLLRRDDCVAGAPDVVARALWSATTEREPRRPGGRGMSARRGSDRKAADPIVEEVMAVLDEADTDVMGDVSVFLNRLGPGAERILRAEGHTGVIRWLELAYRAGVDGSMEHAIAALAMLGSGWRPTEWLPRELRRALPVPLDPRITPCDMIRLIQGRSMPELVSMIASGNVGGVAVGPAGDVHLASFQISLPSNAGMMKKLAEKYPTVAWIVWCYRAGEREEGRISPVEPGTQEVMVRVVETNPFLTLALPEGVVWAGLAALGPFSRRALDAVADVGLCLPLRFGGHGLRLGELAIELPRDATVLGLVASAHISAAAAALRGRGPIDGLEEVRARVSRLGVNLDQLRATAESALADRNARAGAVLLSALHPGGGLAQLEASTAILHELAQYGVPVAGGVAVVVEVLGAWQQPTARSVLSRLIDASRVSATAPGLKSGSDWCLDAVLKVWRQRSTAPVSSSGAALSWLGW